MIVGSLLLILVAVGLLVAGVLGGSNVLIICCIVLVVLAAIVLVLGVKQSTTIGVSYGPQIDGDAQETSEYPRVDAEFRVRQPDRRRNEEAPAPPRRATRAVTAAASERAAMLIENQITRNIPIQSFAPSAPLAGEAPVRRSTSHARPDDDDDEQYAPPAQPNGAAGHEALVDDAAGYDAPRHDALGHDAFAEGADLGSASAFAEAADLDEDPPDEPSTQIVSPATAARIARLTTSVLVVDGRPRYHVPSCVHLHGRESEPLSVGEAVELGFTPCALCEPDSVLLADARPV